MMEAMRLIKPDASFARQIMAYRQEFLDAGDSMDGTGALRGMTDAAQWLAHTETLSSPDTLPEGWVQATQFICVRAKDDRLMGMIQLRHRLNDYLAKCGGHIGYSVRPSERRKGVAGWMLSSILPYCRTVGLERVLITCRETNEASRKTILLNGGVYESTVFDPEDNETLERYWIAL